MFSRNLANKPSFALDNSVTTFKKNDILFCLDLSPKAQSNNAQLFSVLKLHGVKIVFTVYDLILVNMPQYFYPNSDSLMKQWLQVVANADLAICISQFVQDELKDWVSINSPRSNLLITYNYLGADFEKSIPQSHVSPQSHDDLLFLMVALSLKNDAEILWASKSKLIRYWMCPCSLQIF